MRAQANCLEDWQRDSRTPHPQGRHGPDAGGARLAEALRLVRRPGPGRHAGDVHDARVPLAGAAEFFGGLLFALGLLTPFAAIALVVVMLNAIVTVHWQKGFFVTADG